MTALNFFKSLSVIAFNDGGELGITDAGHLASGANRTRADADFNDISARQDQFFRHVAGDDVAGHDGKVREFFSDFGDEIDENLRVAVGDVDTEVLDSPWRTFHDCFEFLQIVVRDAHGIEGSGLAFETIEIGDILVLRVMFVERHGKIVFSQGLSHFKGSGGVHVGSNDRDAGVFNSAVAQCKRSD